MATANKRTPSQKTATEHDAISMLKADHDKVRDIFKQFEELMDEEGSSKEKAALAQQACDELKIHAQIEEEIFYPAVREAIDDDELMDEATVEHAGVKELIEQIEAMRPEDDLYDAKVIVLGEQVEHHATEEEDEMFPMVKKAKVDTAALGEEMYQRKMALIADMGISEEGENDLSLSRGAKKKPKSASGRTLS